jgi:secondary thiamine-phosphate synthase enzyme
MQVKTVELHYRKPSDEIGYTDITRQVEHAIVDSKMDKGIAVVYAKDPNTCITTMEHEPGAINDFHKTLNKIDARTAKGKGHRDVRPALIGSSITVPFKDNREMLGKWQKVVLVDFDGHENTKKVIVQIMGE